MSEELDIKSELERLGRRRSELLTELNCVSRELDNLEKKEKALESRLAEIKKP